MPVSPPPLPVHFANLRPANSVNASEKTVSTPPATFFASATPSAAVHSSSALIPRSSHSMYHPGLPRPLLESKIAKNEVVSSINSSRLFHGRWTAHATGFSQFSCPVHVSPGAINAIALINVPSPKVQSISTESTPLTPIVPVRAPLHNAMALAPKSAFTFVSSSNSSPSANTFKVAATAAPLTNHSANKNVTADADAAMSAPNANTARDAANSICNFLIILSTFPSSETWLSLFRGLDRPGRALVIGQRARGPTPVY
jgi:hypothetical protein